MSTILDRIDPVLVTEKIRKEWNGRNYQQRTMWVVINGFPLLPLATSWDFDDLPEKIQDALFCEFMDLAQKELE